jgi:hypothetical protein
MAIIVDHHKICVNLHCDHHKVCVDLHFSITCNIMFAIQKYFDIGL